MEKFNIKKSIREITKKFNDKEFEPYIQHIRFPFFKNIVLGSKIEFNFPITVLVGKNGTNKSSVIKALYGCPNGYSIRRFWFSTEIDNMDDINTEKGVFRSRYIYGYSDVESGFLAEVLQVRINAAKHNVDYWETSRPLAWDKMELPDENIKSSNLRGTRWKKLSKKVLFIDFRSEISAFDRFMYHADFNSDSGRTKQDFIRYRTKSLKYVIDNDLGSLKKFTGKKEHIIENTVLTAEEVDVVSFILNKKYDRIRYIEHKLFKLNGGTAILETKKLKYSEAFAGSGEFAVVSLVKAISRAGNNSLILLDEPEVSLHPGAQKRLMFYIYKQVLEKNIKSLSQHIHQL
ncbi:AAA family ATPase [Yersinia aldovae]|uniref:AAA family ATPase n=1 Tax=Yersinia aldovae TaxID=29483 RepID=UPI0005AD3490|nr:AAA family ATPase [Yersinia aldovae]AJJ64778.1 AAA domain protein [Yersinia aldovae 670-83]